MKIRMIAVLVLLTTASGAALAQAAGAASDVVGAKAAASDIAAAKAVHAAPACPGPSCTPATANHAISEKGTPGTACPKPTAPPPSTGGGCNNPCTCPPPN